MTFTDEDLKRLKEKITEGIKEQDGCLTVFMDHAQALLARLEAAENTITAERCPDCPDQGWYWYRQPSTEDAGQAQCQYCFVTPNSLFHALEAWKKAAGK